MGDLERRMRRLERINLALGLGLALAVLMAARKGNDATFDSVTARRFQVVDEQGNSRAFLGGNAKGAHLLLGEEKDGSGVAIRHENGTPSLWMSKTGTQGSVRVTFSHLGSPEMIGNDVNGETAFEVPKAKPFSLETTPPAKPSPARRGPSR